MQNQNKQTLQQLLTDHKFEQAYSYLKIQISQSKQEITSHDFCELCELCNYIAMVSLKQSGFDRVTKYLKRAQKYAKYSPYLTLVTNNNWACYYKKINNHSMALLYMNKAIGILVSIKHQLLKQGNFDKIRFLADCYLNLCAILSNMGQHEIALENAIAAVNYIQDEIIEYEKDHNCSIQMHDRHNVLVIAKFNMAVQLEHLRRYKESLQAYKGLRQYIVCHFFESHNLLSTVENAMSEIEQKISKKKPIVLKIDLSAKVLCQKKCNLPSIGDSNQKSRRSSIANSIEKNPPSTARSKRNNVKIRKSMKSGLENYFSIN